MEIPSLSLLASPYPPQAEKAGQHLIIHIHRMTNKELARTFQFLGNIMELHGENPYKIRSYQNAYIQLRKFPHPIAEMPQAEIEKIKGVGNAISSKIRELLDTGEMATLERYKSQTPEGVQEMLNIKGFGPKKIRTIWKDLGAETIGELLYAVNENRLIELKGFGAKTQEDLRQKLEYFQQSQGQFHLATLEPFANEVLAWYQEQLPNTRVALCGAIRRQENEVESVELLIGQDGPLPVFTPTEEQANYPIIIYQCLPEAFGTALFEHTGDSEFQSSFINKYGDLPTASEEEAVFTKLEAPYFHPALRTGDWALDKFSGAEIPDLIQPGDIKGVVHAHTTYSDGINSIEEMVAASRELGYSYLTITDHSKSAFYANGLQPARVWEQMETIDRLNQQLDDFTIFKGIESDILNDGSLDYDEDVLKAFDLIIASVHSNLRMDELKATQRLITAIENPYTSILGHPTGRLLLSRKGYPIDHKKVIDACAANGVSIELNANPYRLDLDWTWIPYALEKGILISINPDAHSIAGIKDIIHGVRSAQKGGLTAEQCLNALDADEFLKAVSRS